MPTDIADGTTVRDLVVRYPQTRRVLESYRIDCCCDGDRELAIAAAESGADLDALRADLRAAIEAASDTGAAAERDWSDASVAELVDHILRVHHAFLRKQLPRIAELFEKVVQAYGERDGNTLERLQRVFTSLRNDVDAHLAREEEILFPYIRSVEVCANARGDRLGTLRADVQSSIRQLVCEHDRAGLALAELAGITSNYLAPTDACPTFTELYDALRELRTDLRRHVHLENNILFPKAVALAQGPLAG